MREGLTHRRSIRLKGRDYSWPDTYFVTICTAERKYLLGRIEDGVMRENVLGRLVRAHWMEIPRKFASTELDVFVVMPNHVHGMISLHRRVAAAEEQYRLAEFGNPQSGSISWIVRAFKATVTREGRRVLSRPELAVWQRNYFERVVRNSKEYEDAYRYISENPRNWDQDEENLAAKASSRGTL
jgi:REP element-mobilizing transposase RayT